MMAVERHKKKFINHNQLVKRIKLERKSKKVKKHIKILQQEPKKQLMREF